MYVALAMSYQLMADEGMLAELALDGVREAWDTLIKRHNHRVVVSLLARGVDLDRAKYLAQETWIRLIEQQRLGRLPRIELPGLAMRQAAFLALEDARRAYFRKRAISLPDPPTISQGPEDTFLTKQQMAQAKKALSECSSSAQEVFRLLYEKPDRAHVAVAEEIGISVQRVRQILCEVRKKIRPLLED